MGVKRPGDVNYSFVYRMKRGGDYIFHYYIRDVTDAAKPFTVAGGVISTLAADASR